MPIGIDEVSKQQLFSLDSLARCRRFPRKENEKKISRFGFSLSRISLCRSFVERKANSAVLREKSFDEKLVEESSLSKKRRKLSDCYPNSLFAADTSLINVMCNKLLLAEKNQHLSPYRLISISSCRHFCAVKVLFDFIIDRMSFFIIAKAVDGGR